MYIKTTHKLKCNITHGISNLYSQLFNDNYEEVNNKFQTFLEENQLNNKDKYSDYEKHLILNKFYTIGKSIYQKVKFLI